jgi:UPF0176 protein
MPPVTNISTYRFAALSDLKPLREQLLARCREWNLKGTILLSTEGINMFVAGDRARIDDLLAEVRKVPGLEGLPAKHSLSDHQPFKRMLVKIKKEIISFGVEGVDPVGKPSPKLPPKELKRWLDEGRSLTLLDTRNDYEVELGTFRNALVPHIDTFRQFPAAMAQLPPEMKKQPIVMFCTGGIRCEKAGPFMEMLGYEQIYQLDGGILKYFEECGEAHYDGECFVFDERVGLNPDLEEAETTKCYACQAALTPEDREDSRFVEGGSCPHCHVSPEVTRAQRIAELQAAIARVTNPLPGSRSYENHRPLNIPAQYDGQTLIDTLCGLLGHVPREAWLAACTEGRVRRKTAPGKDPAIATVAASPEDTVRGGERYVHVHPGTREPDVNADIRVLYEDEAILVLNKPAPLPMHPCGRFNRNTLQEILTEVYRPYNPRPAHRLDANTSGIVLFARTKRYAQFLQPQFERGEVEKRYLARVHGHPTEDEFRSDAPLSDEAGDLGSYRVDWENGRPASTGFKVLQRSSDGTSLLEVTPWTGRTNQIRIHLWDLGFPIVDDPTYLPGHQLGDTQTVALDARPMGLHAWKLTFTHPLTRERVTFEADRPDWAKPGDLA